MMDCQRGVLEVKQISSLDGTSFPEEVKTVVCLLETFLIGSKSYICLLRSSRMDQIKKVKAGPSCYSGHLPDASDLI